MRRASVAAAALCGTALLGAAGCGSSAAVRRASHAPEPATCAPAAIAAGPRHPCLDALDHLPVDWVPAEPHAGIEVPVEIRNGRIGGVTYKTWGQRRLVLDCSLVYSLAQAGPILRREGIDEVFYSSAYQIRNVKGTNRPSKHSFGLAIDLHVFKGVIGKWTVKSDWRRHLRPVQRRLVDSGLFRHVLGPEFDADHRDHFHVEARPWEQRSDVERHVLR